MREEEANDGTVAQEAMAKFTIEKVLIRLHVAIDSRQQVLTTHDRTLHSTSSEQSANLPLYETRRDVTNHIRRYSLMSERAQPGTALSAETLAALSLMVRG